MGLNDHFCFYGSQFYSNGSGRHTVKNKKTAVGDSYTIAARYFSISACASKITLRVLHSRSIISIRRGKVRQKGLYRTEAQLRRSHFASGPQYSLLAVPKDAP